MQDPPVPVMRKLNPAFRWGGRIVGAATLLYFGYFYYSLATGKERVTEICRQMTPGMTIEQLTELAKTYGLGPNMPRPATPFTYLAEARSFGRHACRVDFENGVVKSAAYNYAD